MTEQPLRTAFIESAVSSSEELGQKAGLVDSQQLLRFLTIDERIERFGAVDVTNMSDEEFLASILD